KAIHEGIWVKTLIIETTTPVLPNTTQRNKCHFIFTGDMMPCNAELLAWLWFVSIMVESVHLKLYQIPVL
ncbi:hypothetical protein, partial [Prevotella denticola]